MKVYVIRRRGSTQTTVEIFLRDHTKLTAETAIIATKRTLGAAPATVISRGIVFTVTGKKRLRAKRVA